MDTSGLRRRISLVVWNKACMYPLDEHFKKWVGVLVRKWDVLVWIVISLRGGDLQGGHGNYRSLVPMPKV